MKALLHAGALALVIAVAVVAVGIRYFVPQPRPLAVVDVAEVFRAKERQFTEMLTRSGAGEAERKAAMASAADFAKQLPVALDGLSNECGGCVVLLNTAVVSRAENVLDLTPVLRQKLGLLGP